MPSPFPGMNPYLEQVDVWQDFHNRFVPALGDALAARLGSDYVVKIEEHLFIHEPAAEQRFLLGRSDVSVAKRLPTRPDTSGTATLTSPMMARLPTVEFEKHLFLELRDRKNRDLITVLEMLSPANKKPGADREQYLAKRANLLRSTAHLVEIDLLRGGPRMPIEEATDCRLYRDGQPCGGSALGEFLAVALARSAAVDPDSVAVTESCRARFASRSARGL